MKQTLFLLFALLLMASCADKQEFKVTGSFANDDFNGKTIYLVNFQQEKIGSTTVKDKQFELNGNTAEVSSICFIQYDQPQNSCVFFPEAGNIKLTFDDTMVPNITGTPLNDNYQTITDNLNQMVEKNIQEIEEKQITEEEYNALWDQFLPILRNTIYESIKQNIQNPVGEFMFLSNFQYLDPKHVIELLPLMSAEFRAMDNVQRAKEIALAETATGAGETYIDVKGKSLDGKEVALSDYAGKGKIVLVDFWASWCAPCIRTLPGLVSTYQKYKNKGFEIVGISLDNNQQNWANATAKYQITWPQLSNLEGWSDPAAQAYGINSIPATLLLDGDGTIIGKNLNEAELEQKLSELLK